MGSLAAFLVGIAGSLAKRVLLALGIGFVTMVGFDTLANTLKDQVRESLNALGSAVYQVLALAGVIDAFGIWFGAFTAVLTLMTITKLTKLAS